MGTLQKTTNQIIKEFINIHGDFYDYSQIEYKNTKEKLKIICPLHGEFYQSSSDHQRAGCAKCGLEKELKQKH